MTEEVVLALGSNVGNRRGQLQSGIHELVRVLEIHRISSFYESRAAIFEDQPDFLNLVLVGTTSLTPRQLLEAIQDIERKAGRVRSFHGAPRTLDIDILLFGDRLIDEPALIIPHPGWRTRAFVLAPLAEVDPDRVDPESGMTVDELWQAKRESLGEVHLFAPPPSPSSPPSPREDP